MGVGRNLAYQKKHFQAHNGLEPIKESLSGDDDLLINRFAKTEKTALLVSQAGQVESDPETSWKDWVRQKKRHISASPYYTLQSKLILAIFHGAHAIFYVSLIVYFLVEPQWGMIFAFYFVYTLLKALLLGWIGRQWKISGISIWFAVHDFLFFIYNLALVPAGLLSKPKWR